jgi:hypothetical protein
LIEIWIQKPEINRTNIKITTSSWGDNFSPHMCQWYVRLAGEGKRRILIGQSVPPTPFGMAFGRLKLSTRVFTTIHAKILYHTVNYKERRTTGIVNCKLGTTRSVWTLLSERYLTVNPIDTPRLKLVPLFFIDILQYLISKHRGNVLSLLKG